MKQGYGSEVIYILNCFADKAIEKIEFPHQAQINILNGTNNFDLSNFNGKEQNEYLEEDEDDDAKYLFENQQYTLIEDDDYEKEELSLKEDLDDLNNLNDLDDSIRYQSLSHNRIGKENLLNANSSNKTAFNFKHLNLSRPIMKSSIDAKQWSEEYEQMLPQLKLANRMLEESGNNWRIRFDELKKRNNLINTELNQCNDGLGKLEIDVQKSLDRLDSRERYVQQQMDALCNELLAYRSELTRSMEKYQQINGGVIGKSKRLAELNETIQRVKTDTERREQLINDKTPLISLKQSLNRLKSEINELNIRLGVSFHNVMQNGMQQKLQKTTNPQKNDYNLNSNYDQSFGHLLNMSSTKNDLRLIY